MILAMRPELVRGTVSEIPEVPFGTSSQPASRGWIMTDRSQPGHVGFPAAATAELGEQLFDLFAAGVAAYLQRMVDWDGESWNL
jgi:creatinine amidohydrolase